MLGSGCVVSQYPQFFDQHLENYQLLLRQYLDNFEGDNGERMKEEKLMLYLAGGAEKCL